MDARTINAQLKCLYSEYWDALLQAIPRKRGYSFPILMDANTSYPVAPVKIMIIGQQTNGWLAEFGTQPVAESISMVMTEYGNFNRGENYRSTPFWVAAHLLQQTINPVSDKYGVMWSNLVRVDYYDKIEKKHKRPIAIEAALCHLPLLQKEIEIVKPDVVVFFTGPEYDERLKTTFPNVNFNPIPAYEAWHLARIIHPQLPRHTYRTYHPGYLHRNRQITPIINKIGALVHSE